MVENPISVRIQSFVLDKFPLARKQGIRSSDHLLDTGVVDSLGVLDLVTFIEQEFGITVVDEELGPENFQTIECLAGFVERKRNGVSP
jgi:acyl carrier protein